MDHSQVTDIFREQFGEEPEIVVRAPGRINLIGEHTDYNAGYVMPAAIDKAIWLAANTRTDQDFAFYALDLDEYFCTDNGEISLQTEHKWANYLLGVISEARKDGMEFGGLNIAFGGDIPLGAGLSSSAALESGAMFVLNELFELGLEKLDIVRLAQRGENNFVGMKCGIMDMFASVMGREHSIVRLDCRTMEFAYFPFDNPEYSLILCDTRVKHALVDSEYNTRRAECEEGVAVLKQFDPSIQSLRDVSLELLQQHKNDLREVVYHRCKFILEEIIRVEAACEALQQHDMNTLGQLMFATHDGLSRDYEVSCPELDFLVETARAFPAVAGARMMGGGFGGCTINLVKNTDLEAFTSTIQESYQARYQIELPIYPVDITAGVAKIEP